MLSINQLTCFQQVNNIKICNRNNIIKMIMNQVLANNRMNKHKIRYKIKRNYLHIIYLIFLREMNLTHSLKQTIFINMTYSCLI